MEDNFWGGSKKIYPDVFDVLAVINCATIVTVPMLPRVWGWDFLMSIIIWGSVTTGLPFGFLFLTIILGPPCFVPSLSLECIRPLLFHGHTSRGR